MSEEKKSNLYRSKRIYDTVKWGILLAFLIILINVVPLLDNGGELGATQMIVSIILIVFFFSPSILQKQYETELKHRRSIYPPDAQQFYYTDSVWKIALYRGSKIFYFFTRTWPIPDVMGPEENRKWSWRKKKGRDY